MNWAKIPGLPDAYEVSETGIIRATRNGHVHVMKPNKINGYDRVTIRVSGVAKICAAHRMVALAFIPNPNSRPYVHHKNGNRCDNRVENLEWVTPAENIAHAVKAGTILKGDSHPMSKLTEVQVQETKALLGARKHTIGQLSRMYHVSKTVVSVIYRGGRNTKNASRGGLGYISDASRKRVAAPYRYGDELVMKVNEALASGKTRTEVGAITGASFGLIQRIASGKRTTTGCSPGTATVHIASTPIAVQEELLLRP